MPTFEVKQVQVPLFGVVEASNQEPWHAAFAANSVVLRVEVDASALDIIAEDLEIDAEGLAAEAERYVNGRYRPKTHGMGGSQLGSLGEVLTFLVNRVPGREITRVVSWRSGGGRAIKGSKFPQPDFILKDANGTAALEVKSTQALDFLKLHNTTKKWTALQPCSSVDARRNEALPQLAFVEGVLTPQQHSLVVRSGLVVPFPVGKGVATAVLAVDGRVNALRTESKYKTPKSCRDAGRNCWSCLPNNCHFVLVTMPNAPGMLSLGGASADGSATWLSAYQRWSQALASHDLLAARSSLGALVDAVMSWKRADDDLEAETLRRFWGSYLSDAMRSRGFDVEVPEQLGHLNSTGFDFGWTPAPVADPSSRESSVAEMSELIYQAQESVEPIMFMTSARVQLDEVTQDTLSIRSSGEFVEFHLVSETWWTQAQVETTEEASRIASRLMSLALEVSDRPVRSRRGQVPLQEIAARVGDHEVRLGWEAKSMKPHSAAWRRWMQDAPFWFDDMYLGLSLWPALLAFGDPRIRLRVTPDGRANLRVMRTMLRPR